MTPSEPPFDPAAILAELRFDIDRIDAAMHALLMERGEIIGRLIEVKDRQGGGSAFRPGREAEMMRRFAERHQGLLPFDTAESIWRVIISTFTYVQSKFSVHADISGGDPTMRDTARFHFGFTVPYLTHLGTAGVIEAVAKAVSDLGIVRIDGGAAAGAWWKPLAGPEEPKIIARLPFVERPDHPAGMPVFVIAKPLAEAAARDVILHSVGLERWHHALPAALGEIGGEIVGNAADGVGLSLLIAAPAAATPARLTDVLRSNGCGDAAVATVGSHAARFDFTQRAVRPEAA